MKIDWQNLFKVRIANPDDSFAKHEVVKLLIVMKILKQYKRKHWIRVYTEFRLENGSKVDIYFEDLKNKDVYIYEVQKVFSKEWLDRKTKEYKDYDVPFFNSVNFIPIDLNKLSDNLNKLSKELEEYIF